MPFNDLLWPQGQDNMGGLVGNIFFIPVDDVESWPALSAVGSLLMATGNIVPKAGKRFYQIYHTPETGKIDYNTVGETDAKSKENLLEFLFPGDDRELAETERLLQNTVGLYICRDTKGYLRVLGLTNLNPEATTLVLDSPAFLVTSNGMTGQARADRRGTTFVVKHSASHRPVFYEGIIQLEADGGE
jgi:hypothetical protein